MGTRSWGSSSPVHGAMPLIIGGALTLALVVGVMSGAAGNVGFLLAFGGVVALIMLRWPLVGLLVLLASISVENLLVLESARGATGTRLLGLAVFGSWIVGKFIRKESLIPIFTSRLTVFGGLLVAMALASVIWARVPGAAQSGAMQFIQFLALAILCFDMARSWERADLMVKAVVVGATLAAFLTLEQALLGGARRAGGNIAGGINATAILLVTVLPLAFYLIRSGESRVWSLLGVGYAALAVPAVLLTYSRMNLLVLPLILGLLVFDTLRGGRGRGWVTVGAATAMAVGLYAVPTDRLFDRIETIVPYIEGTVGVQESWLVEPSPRGYHLRLGMEIARDEPILGAGFRNYGHLFREEYQFLVPGPGRIYTSVRSPHSSHVGMMADLGMVGFGLWLALILGAGLLPVVRVRRALAWRKHERAYLLAWALSYALGTQIVFYGWYATIDRYKIFWVLLGMAWAVRVLWREDHAQARTRPAEGHLGDSVLVRASPLLPVSGRGDRLG